MFDWIVGWVESGGYLAIALLMLVENVFPPIPSEPIMPLAGFAAAKGTLNIVGVVAAGTAGSLAGALFWFWVGYFIGPDRLKTFSRRHGRWLTLHPSEIDLTRAFFDRHQGSALFFGRRIPTAPDLDLGPGRCRSHADPYLPRLVGPRDGVVDDTTCRGRLSPSGQYERVADRLNPVSNVLFAALAIWYVSRVMRFHRNGGR